MSNVEPVALSFKYNDANVEKTFQDFQSATNYMINYVRVGSGDPNNVELGSKGMLFLRTDGGAGTCLYVKEAGTVAVPTKTDWVAK